MPVTLIREVLAVTRDRRLQGRTCLIVGGTSGIGLATARRFLGKGRASSSAAGPRETADEAQAELGRSAPAWAITADAADPAQVEPPVRRRRSTLLGGRLDVLFHVAGISGRRFGDGPLHECTVEGWDAVLDANARSTVPDQPGGRPTDAGAAARRRRPARDGAEHGLGARPVAVARLLRHLSPTPRARGRSAR